MDSIAGMSKTSVLTILNSGMTKPEARPAFVCDDVRRFMTDRHKSRN